MRCRAKLDELFEEEFAAHEAAMADDYASRPDIKNTLLAEFIRRGMTLDEIGDNVATVMFAAHDTTSSLMQVCL
jgi:cytochrome P450